jgi:hypothetical protein
MPYKVFSLESDKPSESFTTKKAAIDRATHLSRYGKVEVYRTSPWWSQVYLNGQKTDG